MASSFRAIARSAAASNEGGVDEHAAPGLGRNLVRQVDGDPAAEGRFEGRAEWAPLRRCGPVTTTPTWLGRIVRAIPRRIALTPAAAQATLLDLAARDLLRIAVNEVGELTSDGAGSAPATA